jgi:hypothetical protein
MKDSHSEQSKIKKAMKLHEIVSSDKEEFAACTNDLIRKIGMDSTSAKVVAESMRDMYLPKLLSEEGIDEADLPDGFIGKMTDDDDHFTDDTPDDDHNDIDDEDHESHEEEDELDSDEDYEFDEFNDDGEVDDDEIATIHISVPTDKIREVEKALESVLGDKDHKDNTGDKDMDKKQIEARKALRKTILAQMQDDESQSVSRTNKFDYDSSEQYRELDHYNTKSMGMSDPEFDTLDYSEARVPNFTDLIDHVGPDLGLIDGHLKPSKFDGVPSETDEFTLEFNAFEIPSQGNKELYHEAVIPSEGDIPLKRTINSSTSLGNFDADEAEQALAFALRTAGVDDEDLGKLTYAEGLELFKAIRTAAEEKAHYTTNGVMNFTQNTNITDPDGLRNSKSHEDKKAVTEDPLDEAHTHQDMDTRKKLYSSMNNDGEKDAAYAKMLAKLMRGDEQHEGDKKEDVHEPAKMMDKAEATKIELQPVIKAEAELYKARLKTAYACSSKLSLAGILPANEVDAYAEGMISDGLTVTSMIKQTNLMLANAQAHAEKLAASKNTKVASAGITFNPSVRTATNDMSGAMDIQNALRSIGWTTAKVETGMED